jgi:predicted O-linked N-acetylglucosamine transferase (SPINDLY family)
LGDPWENIALTNAADYSVNFLEMLVIAETLEDVQRLAQLHRDWGKDVLQRLTQEPLPAMPKRKPGGKLKLGIISSDLRHHSVAKFVLPVLENYDRDKFEIYCYAPFDSPNDGVQSKIKGLVSSFRIVENVSDREYAEIIRDDKIDILFELNGFTRDSRLKVLAYKPAPVQVGWLGYPFTTGVTEIDYFILDQYVKPTSDDLLVETPVCLPESFVCFDSFPEETITEIPPFERNDFITFGSLNNPYKVTRQAIAVWAEVLNRVPGSRFLYIRPELDSMVLCNNITNEFGRHGIGPERIYFVNNWNTGLSHFSFYDEIDITLDTFPLTGGTTTCDSLWMGTPLISKYGPGMHQRLSYSVMSNVGLQDLCVETNEEYVNLVVSLAEDPESLRLLRKELRPSLKASPLCQADEYAKHFCNLMSEIAERHGLC